MVFTTVRLQGERYPFFYSYIVFFITDLCCLGVGVLCKLSLDLYMPAGHRSSCYHRDHDFSYEEHVVSIKYTTCIRSPNSLHTVKSRRLARWTEVFLRVTITGSKPLQTILF